MNDIDKIRYNHQRDKILKILQQDNLKKEEKPEWLNEMYIKIKNEKKYTSEEDKKYQQMVDSLFSLPEKISNFSYSLLQKIHNFFLKFIPNTEETKNTTFIFLLFIVITMILQKYTKFMNIFDELVYLFDRLGFKTMRNVTLETQRGINKVFDILWTISFLFENFLPTKEKKINKNMMNKFF
eukprot:gene10174-2594_t